MAMDFYVQAIIYLDSRWEGHCVQEICLRTISHVSIYLLLLSRNQTSAWLGWTVTRTMFSLAQLYHNDLTGMTAILNKTA